MTDFSQFGEQDTILEWAAGRGGAFLEVGAYDGISYSNTRALMLAGWSGIAVEPAPDMYVKLRDATAGYPVECIEAACVAAQNLHRTARLRWTPGQPFSSLVQGERYEEATVATVTVFELVEKMRAHQVPWFLSLDTEGTTVGLLAMFLAESPNFSCVCVEAHTNVADERPVALMLLEMRGYRVVHENPVNVVAVKP